MFEVGQKVWCVMFGEGVVTEVLTEDANFPVEVRFGDVLEYYTLGGKYRTYVLQTLFPHPIRIVKQVVKPYIDWEHVNPKFKYLAQDSDGDVWLYTDKPTLAITVWAAGGEIVDPRMFASYVEGTCDWKESLIQRPEGDSHDD